MPAYVHSHLIITASLVPQSPPSALTTLDLRDVLTYNRNVVGSDPARAHFELHIVCVTQHRYHALTLVQRVKSSGLLRVIRFYTEEDLQTWSLVFRRALEAAQTTVEDDVIELTPSAATCSDGVPRSSSFSSKRREGRMVICEQSATHCNALQ